MGQTKTLGEQLDIQDMSVEIANDTTAITTMVTGLITDLGSRDIIYEDFVYNAINEEVNNQSVVDVFIYNTSLDDDGGAWIANATHQSWYTETLNTSTRGATRSFPKAGVLVVAEINTITLYDLSKSDLPMWMVFTDVGGSVAGGAGAVFATTIYPINEVKMLNGILYFDNVGLVSINFKTEEGIGRANLGVNTRLAPKLISERNTAHYWKANTDLSPIVNVNTTSIAVASNGKGGNIEFVATTAGLSRIEDGLVSNWTDNGGSVNIVNNVAVDADYVYWSNDNSYQQKMVLMWPVSSPLVEFAYYNSNVRRFDAGEGEWVSSLVKLNYGGVTSNTQAVNAKAIVSNRSLSLIYPNYDNGGNAMVATVTADFNSGIMHGDIRGAWLANTESGIVGVDETTESIVNGDFPVDTNSWIAGNSAILSVVSGAMRVTNVGATYGYGYQIITTVVGNNYTLSVDVVTDNVTGFLTIRAATAIGIGDLGQISTGTIGTHILEFTATTTTTYIILLTGSNIDAEYAEYDNVSVTPSGELISNGMFNNGTDSWTVGNNADLSIVNGRLRVAWIDSNHPVALQTIGGLTIGETYTVTADVFDGTATARADLDTSIEGNGNLTDGEFTFLAVDTWCIVQLFAATNAAGYAEFDNISIRLADPDRSYKNEGLQVHGQITKSPVALDSELMGYSGFSPDNFLEQAYNPDLNFGTGDFYIGVWCKPSNTVTVDYIIDRYNGGVGSRFALYIESDNTVTFTTYDGGTSVYKSTLIYVYNIWNFIFVIRKSDGSCVININGEQDMVAGIVRDISVSDSPSMVVGVNNNHLNAIDGSLSLIRVGAGAPTADQATTIYKQEKPMFAPGSKVTLQGTSSYVKAVDYDESTNIVTACSLDHITKFNDLVVVDDRAEIATSVSTTNDYEITGS